MKTIDLNSGEFMANGKKYLIQFNKLSIERYSMYEKLGLELGFGVGYKGIFDAFLEVFNALTKGNNLLEAHHKASTIAFNQLTAIQKQGDSRVPSQIMFCTLFCNTEGEDLSTWDEDLALRKINDWKVEGLNVISFFHLASNFLIGFTDHLKVEALEKIMLEIPTLTALTDSVLNKENTGKKGGQTKPKRAGRGG